MLRTRVNNILTCKNQLSLTYRGQKYMTADAENLERAKSVTSFYYQNAIDNAAAKVRI